MQVQSTLKYVRISAFKAREVAREIQGKPVADALDLCRFTPKKAARLLEKTLKSAIANAENNNNLRAADLVVKEALVGEGPTIKRYSSRARGSGTLIRKRTSHIRIVLAADNPPSAEGEAESTQAKGKASGSPASGRARSGGKSPKVAKAAKTEKAAAPSKADTATAEG